MLLELCCFIFVVLNILLCLICKLNFIMSMYVDVEKLANRGFGAVHGSGNVSLTGKAGLLYNAVN